MTHANPQTAGPTTVGRVFLRLVFDGWRGMFGWIIGIAAVLGLYLPLYPSIASDQMTELINNLPTELVEVLGYEDVVTGAGYTQATFFGLLGYVLIAIAATAWGAAFIAGTEETGRLELTLAHAVGRVQYATESLAALLAKLLMLALVVYLMIWALNDPSELDLSAANLLAVTIAWASLGLLSGTAALAVGALSGRRLWAIAAGAGVAVLGYLFDAVGSTNDDLQWLYDLSPYHWAYGNSPLAQGFDWAGLALLWGLCAVFIALTIYGLARRDILG
ncbi:ABC transporter permease subunit [Enteractinococcus coprophilus]|uniref:ABC-2 type transport system permease protein n=1 Tax=Enteractinococcus coprophilus TaxID=1027633 RepID=A0A543APF5_9MICC|nr:ABC transporter permease subunit [Enteractinococcus coprophilus]TQL74452.1 ABC-2 type transport system permease protein [Enteractinococcus coprophilus]